MDCDNEFQWPVEMLGRILHFLAMDGASATWKQLADLARKDNSLKNIAKKMRRPLVLRVGFDGLDEGEFVLPFQKATVAQIEIDWGDGTPTQVVNSEEGNFVSHEYSDRTQEDTVGVFPCGPGLNGIWLNHLGWNEKIWTDETIIQAWWRPLRSFDSLGSLGISSLEAVFYHAIEFDLPLNHLDVENVTNMKHAFEDAKVFNKPLDKWDVSKVTKMSNMFCGATMFNQSLATWNVSRVVRMDNVNKQNWNENLNPLTNHSHCRASL